jgi:hypothetical protein
MKKMQIAIFDQMKFIIIFDPDVMNKSHCNVPQNKRNIPTFPLCLTFSLVASLYRDQGGKKSICINLISYV